MASDGHTVDLSVSTGILLCQSREMSFKIYNESHFDFEIRVVLGQFLKRCDVFVEKWNIFLPPKIGVR